MSGLMLYAAGLDRLAYGGDICEEGYSLYVWRPSWRKLIPRGKGFKYIVYWIFYRFRIFKNCDYGAVSIVHRGETVSSLLVVPAYFKWPFMRSNDLQFTYVMTESKYRERGFAERLLRRAAQEFADVDRVFWYVTEESNTSSTRLCKKVGFEFKSYAHRGGFFNVISPRSN